MFTTGALFILLPFLASLKVVSAQTTCNITNLCPSSTPCCSSYGFCGTDDFCLSGCEPLHSNSLDSCNPAPLCVSNTYDFTNTSKIVMNITDYDGNATNYDWILNVGNFTTSNNSLVMMLTESNGGTRLSLTHYVHYGTITARMKASKWAGVVTAFITMSDIADEIDWEWPGNQTTTAQTNFFWQGVVPSDDTHAATIDNVTDVFDNWHDYTIDWQPDTLTWMIDNETVRSIDRTTYESDGVSQFPNTPSQIEISLWPAGISSEAEGTIEWAGGMIDWSDSDYTTNGYFYALVDSVTVQCADPTSPTSDDTSYVYSSNSTSMTPTIEFSNRSILLGGAERGVGAVGGESMVWWMVGAVVVGALGLL